MKQAILKTLILITIFSLSMAILESAVVVYLRELYYPDGFTVAFKPLPQKIVIVELFREFATLLMLILIGWFAGKNKRTRFAWFLYSFAIWDLFYYIWLKAIINWPSSIFDWDILFLMPFTWLAPIIAPIICSISMILLSLTIVFLDENRKDFRISRISMIMIILGSIIIYAVFTKDYTYLVVQNKFYKDYLHILENNEFINITRDYMPESFSWSWFWLGEFIILAAILKLYDANKVKSINNQNNRNI